MAESLPGFIAPMLAVPGRPFDSDAHLFEQKWDGIRAVALVVGGSLRLVSRNRVDLTARYPSLAELRSLPDGLALDGEIVAFKDGKPDFGLVMSHAHHGAETLRYVAFDLLYLRYDSVMPRPLEERRELLAALLRAMSFPSLLLSEGVRGKGTELYRKACEQGLEGVMAKRLESPYAPGKRNGAWVKIKRRLRLQVAVIGYIGKGKDDFQSLLVASNGLQGEEGAKLRYVGRVGGGFSDEVREELNALLRRMPRERPLVRCPEPGSWVEPGLYCTVSFAESTAAGMLRSPVFEGLIRTEGYAG